MKQLNWGVTFWADGASPCQGISKVPFPWLSYICRTGKGEGSVERSDIEVLRFDCDTLFFFVVCLLVSHSLSLTCNKLNLDLWHLFWIWVFVVCCIRSVVKGNCRNLIENLLKNDPVERLPMKPGGVKNLYEHKWFSEHDWDALRSQAGGRVEPERSNSFWKGERVKIRRIPDPWIWKLSQGTKRIQVPKDWGYWTFIAGFLLGVGFPLHEPYPYSLHRFSHRSQLGRPWLRPTSPKWKVEKTYRALVGFATFNFSWCGKLPKIVASMGFLRVAMTSRPEPYQYDQMTTHIQ